MKDIDPGPDSSLPGEMVNVGGTLFFNAYDGTHGGQLWRSDGSAAGTALVKVMNPAAVGSNPSDLTNLNGTLLFTAADGTHGVELWRSDGTPAGTELVKDIDPGPSGSAATSLANISGTLFFVADDGTHGNEFWRSDGTAEGTSLVKDINPGGDSGLVFPRDLEPTGSFDANNGTHTPDFEIPLLESVRATFTNVNGAVYFRADDGTHGAELWQSDGTAAGTRMVADLSPISSAGPTVTGPGGTVYRGTSDPDDLTNVNGTLFFTALDPAVGRELWKTVTAASPAAANGSLAVVGSGASEVVFAVTAGHALWRHDVAGGWTLLGEGIQSVSAVMESSGAVVAFAVTAEDAPIRFDGSGATLLGAPHTVVAVSAGTDVSGRAEVFVLTGDGSFTEYRSTGWLVSPIGGRGSVLQMSASTGGRVVVVGSDHSIFEYDPNIGWYRVADGGFAQSVNVVTEATGNEVIYAQTLAGGLYRHDGAGGWLQIGASGTVVSMSAGVGGSGEADVFVTTAAGALMENDTARGWLSIDLPPLTLQFQAAAGGRLITAQDGGSILEHDAAIGVYWLANPGFLET